MTDLPKLSGPRLQTASGGPARQLVILLHGVGADGDDLLALGEAWSELLPDADFLAPNAPEPCDMAPFGYQWFSLQDRSMPAMLAGVQRSAPILNAFIDAAIKERGLTPANVALVAFSQGTMMALYTALRRSEPVAGVVGYSGALIGAERLADEVRARPPVLLIHGAMDSIVPPQALHAAEGVLRQAGVPVEAVMRPGLDHGIDPQGVGMGGAFLKRVLGA